VVGDVSPAAAAETGLLAGTPVIAGGQDSTVVALAVGAIEAGQSVVMRGTTDLLCLCTEHGDYHPGLYTTHAVLPNLYIRYDMQEVVAAGGSYQWLATMLYGEATKARFEIMNELAGSSPAGSNGLIYLPYLLISTQPDPARQRAGSFFGLTTTAARADLCRAVMEGTACALRETVERLARNHIRVTELRLTGGPTESTLWNQITADVTGLPVLVPPGGGGAAAYGAALLAGLGAGVIPMDDGYATLRRLVTLRQRFEAQVQTGPAYQRLYAAFCQLASHTSGIAAQLKAGTS
jgi:xylulokinase